MKLIEHEKQITSRFVFDGEDQYYEVIHNDTPNDFMQIKEWVVLDEDNEEITESELGKELIKQSKKILKFQ